MTIKYKDLSGSYYQNFNEKNSNALSLSKRRAITLFSKSIGCTVLSGSPNPVFWLIYKENNKQKEHGW